MTSPASYGDRQAGAAVNYAPGTAWMAVVDWIYHQCTLTDHPRKLLVLHAIARHCTSADGSGARAGYERLGAMTRISPSTVRHHVEWLEEAAELVIQRPAPGHGRGNHYVVVMGRPLEECRLLLPAARRLRSRTAASEDLPGAAPASPPGPVPATPGAALVVHRGAVPSPPDPTEPCDDPATTLRRTRDPGSHGSRSGSRRTTGAAGAAPPRARAAPVDPRLQQLRDLVEDAGILTRWDLLDDQAAIVAAQVTACGAQALAEEAIALAQAKGAPRSVRAWLTPWELLPPKREERPATPWCGRCDSDGYRYVVDDDANPVAKCPACHPAVTAPTPF